MNNSGIEPVGHFVLIEPEETLKSKAGAIVIPDIVEDRYAMAQTMGTLVAVGNTAWQHPDFGNGIAWATVGDRVVYARYSGIVLTGKDGKQYRLVSDADIKAVADEGVSLGE